MQRQEYLYKSPNYAANLNDMRLKDKYCDVTIKVDGKEIRAHKVILVANLKYFETMFSSNSFQESQGGVIIMKSVDKADLELFVSYAYTGEILLTDSNALNLLELANYLSEDDIKGACISFLENHVKAEKACRAYKFASKIDCLSLKNAAKAKILKNFGDCLESAEYLNSDPESLTEILSDGKAQSILIQKMLFEGIMRWIWHDAKDRKICVDDLLDSIDVTKLTADDIMSCLHRNLVHRKDEYGITSDVIMYYEARKNVRKEHDPVLIMNKAASFQFYNFIEKKWFPLRKTPIIAVNIVSKYSAILNDKLFFIARNVEEHHLHVFDLSLKQFSIFPSSSSILKYASLCACNRSLYICGGSKPDGSRSKQILKYTPQNNSFETLTSMTSERSSAAIIFYQDCLYVVGGYAGSSDIQLVEKYNIVSNEWTALAPMCEKRRGHAVATLDGKLYACGGFVNGQTVEVYDPLTNRWHLVASMNKQRSYFLLVAQNDKLLAIGGDGNETIETYDPSNDQWQMDHEMSSGMQEDFCIGGLISSSFVTHT